MSDLKTAAVILAGGQSRRFGSDKAFHEIGGKPMIRHVAEILGSIFSMVIVAGGNRRKMQEIGLKCFPDPIPGKGALGGVYNGLVHTDADSIFFCGCDMPLLNREVISIILDRVDNETTLIPMINDKRQPLHAVYPRKICPVVERLGRCEGCFLPDLWPQIEVTYLNESAFSHIENYHLSFVIQQPRSVCAGRQRI